MHFQLKKTIAHVTVLSALIPIAACTGGGQVKGQRNPEQAQVAALRDPDLAPKRGDYSYDTVQSHVVRTTVTGECVATIFWTPAGATQECHPSLFGKTAPRAAAPAPQAAPQPQAAAQPAPQAATTVTETVEYEAMQYTEPSAAAEAPMEDFYAPGDVAGLVPVPPPSADERADDRISESRMYYEEEAVESQEGIVGRREYYEEEETVQKDDGIVSQSQYYEEEETVQKDDGIVSESRYYEEEESVQKDDGIVSESRYYEEEETTTDETVTARSEYYEEEGKQPEDLISEPKAVEESAVAAAEQEQAPAAPAAAPQEQAAAPAEEAVEPAEEQQEEAAAPAEEQAAAPAEAAAAPAEVQQEQAAAPVVAAAEQEQPAAPVVAQAEKEQSAAPAEAAPTPQPTPVVLPLTITLEAEPWFDFDRYTVRSDSRDKLDTLVTQMQGVEYDQIVVVGHADPIGTPEYNQVLSERRARAVKNYLVGKGVPADRIRTEGRGEFDLPFDPALCKGQKGKKYILCLQPDRSVEVTVTGTKPQQ